MQEEYHGNGYKQYYGWKNLSANVWLPSLAELVGYAGTQNATTGCYFSAMQGLNASTSYWTDNKGGVQFAYFKQYNASGGGSKLWNACAQEETWFRSPHCGSSQGVWSIKDEGTMNSGSNPATYSHAVHPAEDTGSKSHFGYTLLKIKEMP